MTLGLKLRTRIGQWSMRTLVDLGKVRGRTRRRIVKKELKEQSKTWREAEAFAINRARWRLFVSALCSPRNHKN